MTLTATKRQPFWGPTRLAWLLGLIGSLAVILTLADPGITIDEPLDVRPGRTYVASLRAKGVRFFDRANVTAVFADNAEHPPLGRWLLGLASTLGEPFEVLVQGGPDPVGIYVVAGRLAPALIFGLMVGLVSGSTSRRYGRGAGVVAGLALLMMPRVFAHAHLGALDTFIAFFWTWTLLAVMRATESPRPVLKLALAGLVWGLALLTKIHAWFLPPLVLVWVLTRCKPRVAVAGFAAWLVVGLSSFLLGWPWLWFDTWHRLTAYLGTGVERVSIQVLYFGQIYADRDVPWHYPWVYFVATIPVGLLALGGWGAVRSIRGRKVDPFPLMLLGSIAMFLVVFSTRVPVYDGERLFLVVFPLFSILVGRGFADLWTRTRQKARVVLALVLVMQGYGVVMIHPFGLSFYNVLIGGLPGAEALGMELTYWGDAIDGRLLDRLATLASEGQTAATAPTLAPDQGKIITTRRLARIPVVIQDQQAAGRADWLLVSRRSAYWTAEVRGRMAESPWVEVRSRQGVWLSALLGARKSKSP